MIDHFAFVDLSFELQACATQLTLILKVDTGQSGQSGQSAHLVVWSSGRLARFPP